MRTLNALSLVLTLGLGLTAFQTCMALSGAIESGEHIEDELAPGPGQNLHTYYFFVLSNDTVIIRAASGDHLYKSHTPYRTAYFPSNFVSNPGYGVFAVSESSEDMVFTNIAKPGWWKLDCSLPAPLMTITNAFAYSLSMLRLFDYPLSYQDPDVGTIHNGQSLGGKIHSTADLDAGFFEVTNRCTVQIRMGQKHWELVPNMQLYGPDGRVIAADLPPEYRAEITAVLTNPGIYTIVCSEKFIGVGEYNLSMVRIPGELGESDPDVGLIGGGDSAIGTIDQPGDLDLAYFAAASGDKIRISMRDYSDADSALNPRLELYDPAGNFITRAADPLQYEASIAHTCLVSGVYYAICKDSEDRKGVRYLFSFDILEGPSLGNIPQPPTNVVAGQGVYPTHIMLSWDAPTNATGYDVYRYFGTNQAVVIATNVQIASYTDYGVTSNRLYTYQVKSRNSFGLSALSRPAVGYCFSDFIAAPRRAILVGIDDYSPNYPVPPLYKCVADARGIRDTMLLSDPRRRWVEGAVQMFANQVATKEHVREMLALQAYTATNGEFVLYTQSSHGGQNSGMDTYLCMHDAAFTDVELAADLAMFKSNVTVVVIVDACHAGGLFKDAAASWPFAERVMEEYRAIMTARYQARGEAPPKGLGGNIAFMTACEFDELSFVSVSNGFYTGFLLNACGLAAVDSNRDGEYQFLELHSYAAGKLLANDPAQHAQSYNDALLGAVIARARGAGGITTNRLILPECDYDGDRQSDLAVYMPAAGLWFVYSLRNGPLAWALPWGGPGMVPVSGDYNGDNITDLAVYELNTGCWYARTLANGPALVYGERWGGRNLMPVSGDYNGDNITDLAVYDSVNGYWFIKTLAGDVLLWGASFVGSGFVPVPGDYNGDGLADLAHYHPSSGAWVINTLQGNIILSGVKFGAQGMLPVPGDFDGDGASDLAVYNGYTGEWFAWSVPEQYIVLWQGLWGGYGFLPAKPNW